MTKDEMLQQLIDLVDDSWQAGWNEGYRRGLEDQEEFGNV